MKVWEFKVTNGNRKRGHVDRAETRGVPCSRSKALATFREEGETPVTEAGLFGLFVESYENRYRRRWPGTTAGSVSTIRDLATMAARVGPEEAARAIRLIFGPRFKWVTNHSSALASKNFYGKCMIPVLADDEEVNHGEQAEWRGEKTDDRGYEEVEL